MISAPPGDGTSNQLCDWMELAVLASPLGRVSLSDINLELEIEGEDFESEDLAADDEVRERRVQQVVNAISERWQTMKSAYPFVRSTSTFGLADNITEGGAAYLFCLVLSNAASGGLLHDLGPGPWVPDLKAARNLFQACASVCAGGYTRGPSFSIGWPRVDSSSFPVKLRQVYSAFGDGKPHAEKPTWAAPNAKDAEIDVISWKQEPDGRPGSTYLLAQAASGANWSTKSIKTAIHAFHTTWFAQAPASHPSPGLIMPFFLPSKAEVDSDDHLDQERIASQYWRTVQDMGVLLYRHRVAYYVDEGVALSNAGISPMEGMELLPEVREWVDAYRTQLQKAVEDLR